MDEIIFTGQKAFPLPSGNITTDILFIEHTTVKKAQYIEIICTDITAKLQSKPIYISTDKIHSIINNEEHEKQKNKNESNVSLSPAALRSLTVQKLLDLIDIKDTDKDLPTGFDIVFLLSNNVILVAISQPDDVTPHVIKIR